ncbi:response regulator transcription factor [Bacillus sp. CLL-7-23]|uniref:Response regulator transcription factor n=1 Tax=Bacillus changyiensis TaxID=3004103 RepID=A0ABT4X0D4_9BACI|nr:response regulator transcription factor [Bacillus changyiensis]MDA7025139.1 response regulator transcription factor [Bacillus changyiensis]
MTTQQTVLVVDDDDDIVRLLDIHLTNEGYHVLKASDGFEAIHLMETHHVCLLILDIMMPGIDGIEVCRKIREKSSIPIILLSAKDSDTDKVVGLSVGADDYIIKPFSTVELMARVKAQLRRYMFFNQNITNSIDQTIRIRGLEMNERSRDVSLYGEKLKLTKTEFEILLLLAKTPNRVYTLEEIFESVWKERYFESHNTVMVHIARLREKLNDGIRDDQIIKNVWGVGYKIEN